MKPLFYFAQCPQLEAIEALNWQDELTDKNKLFAARIVLHILNLELIETSFSTLQNFKCNKRDMLLNAGDWSAEYKGHLVSDPDILN